MNATILCVGTELLFGQIVNTNAAYLSQQLQMQGINVLYHYTVGDNPDRMRGTLKLALAESDLVITSGGLGPTQDDLTKEIIAEILEEELIFDQKALDMMTEVFDRMHREMTENNRKQAYVPTNSTVFYNEAGTAPGFAIEKNGKIVAALPGPPRELTYMFEGHLLPLLRKYSDSVIYYKILRYFGIGESLLESVLTPLIDGQTDPTLATYAKEGECSLRIASKRATKEEAVRAVEEMEEKVLAITGDYLYSDENEDLINVVGRKLIEKGLTISTAESCTGGLLAENLTSISGISAVYERGFITYSNESKTEILGVREETLREFGAVSEQTAREMAQGARERARTDIAVSVTGIAGPGGGSAEKPVGLAYICIATINGSKVKKLLARDRGRAWNRYFFMLEMLNQINQTLDRE